jgi:hypothetical protein
MPLSRTSKLAKSPLRAAINEKLTTRAARLVLARLLEARPRLGSFAYVRPLTGERCVHRRGRASSLPALTLRASLTENVTLALLAAGSSEADSRKTPAGKAKRVGGVAAPSVCPVDAAAATQPANTMTRRARIRQRRTLTVSFLVALLAAASTAVAVISALTLLRVRLLRSARDLAAQLPGELEPALGGLAVGQRDLCALQADLPGLSALAGGGHGHGPLQDRTTALLRTGQRHDDPCALAQRPLGAAAREPEHE